MRLRIKIFACYFSFGCPLPAGLTGAIKNIKNDYARKPNQKGMYNLNGKIAYIPTTRKLRTLFVHIYSKVPREVVGDDYDFVGQRFAVYDNLVDIIRNVRLIIGMLCFIEHIKSKAAL